MYPTRRQLLRTGLLAPLAGCAAPAALDAFAGHYSWGFEESAFEPCGRDERWWVVDDGGLVEEYRAVAEREYEQVYVRLRGRLSEPGSYGHLGEYARELAVVEVLEVRVYRAGDC